MNTAYTVVAAATIALLETLLLFGILFFIFSFFQSYKSLRNKIFYVVSYPGVFAAVGGFIGVVFPLPLVLGLPVWLISLIESKSSLAWIPLPFLTLSTGFDGPTDTILMFFISEVIVFSIWCTFVYVVNKNQK